MKTEVKVGFLSRLDYGEFDCRPGLWKTAYEIFKQQGVTMVFILGGLIKKEAIRKQLQDYDTERYEDFYKKIARFFATNLPVIPGVKTRIITSPAYDGDHGPKIAEALAEVREDIIFFGSGSARMQLTDAKGKPWLQLFTPRKGVFMRSSYYDTPILRVLEDEIRRSTIKPENGIAAVGCFGSAVAHPGDSVEKIQVPYFSVPSLCKADETKVAGDNQIGLVILSFPTADAREAKYDVWSLKDQVAQEWSSVEAPAGLSSYQRRVVDLLRHNGPLSLGRLQKLTKIKEDVLKPELKDLVTRFKEPTETWSGVKYDKSKRYFLDMSWFYKSARYKVPKIVKYDTSVSFSCMHAGCKYSDLSFMVNVLPRLILERNVKTIYGLGDFVEGLKHNLLEKGEIETGPGYILNETKQELLAAYVIGTTMLKVFKKRFVLAAGSQKEFAKNSVDSVLAMIKESMPKFVFIPGNHCCWVKVHGFDALKYFEPELLYYLTTQVTDWLKLEYNFYDINIHKALRSRVVPLSYNQPYTTGSGFITTLQHPEMPRSQTPSIRPQGMLNYALPQKAHIVHGGNFHTKEVVLHYDANLGQRLCIEAGTIKIRSSFEAGKLKIVDFGVVFANAYMDDSNRLVRSETSFYSTPTSTEVKGIREGNKKVILDFDKWKKSVDPGWGS